MRAQGQGWSDGKCSNVCGNVTSTLSFMPFARAMTKYLELRCLQSHLSRGTLHAACWTRCAPASCSSCFGLRPLGCSPASSHKSAPSCRCCWTQRARWEGVRGRKPREIGRTRCIYEGGQFVATDHCLPTLNKQSLALSLTKYTLLRCATH